MRKNRGTKRKEGRWRRGYAMLRWRRGDVFMLALPTMEGFSLLKYWRGSGATADGGANVRSSTTTTIVAAVSHHSAESTDNDEEEEEDDGPFFDLEFTVPDEEDEQEKHEVNDGDEEREDDDIESDGTESEFKFALSSGSSGDRTDPNVSLSPSDDLFFKGRLVPVEPSSIVFNGSDSESNSKSQFYLDSCLATHESGYFSLFYEKSRVANCS